MNINNMSSKMAQNRWLYALIFAALCIGSAALLMHFSKKQKIAYIKIGEVYNNFDLKKELEQKYHNTETARKNLLDSMEFRLKAMQNSTDKNTFEAAVEVYVRKRSELEKANEVLNKEYEGQVWKQINSYCEAYGKKNGYAYILGAQGSGILMYADAGDDITAEVTAYINQSYHGK